MIADCRETSKKLQDLTPTYGTQILVCEETRQIVKDIFHTRELDMVYVKGRTRPVVIFEIMGTADSELAHDMMTVSVIFSNTIVCY